MARPDYPPELFAWLAQQAPAHHAAWDCATGNGQAAFGLAKHFQRVHATDASAQQIANAQPHASIDYAVASGERSNLPDTCVDLITVAQAAHWFDLPAFYTEARRTLKPDGVLAMWCYGLTRIDSEVDRIMAHFDQRIVGPYWPRERRHIDNAYEDLGFPFQRIRAPEFEMQKHWSRVQFLAYIASWSAVQRYQKVRGSNPVDWLNQALDQVWNRDELREVYWPIAMLAGSK